MALRFGIGPKRFGFRILAVSSGGRLVSSALPSPREPPVTRL
jgi:hypothetical protein